MSFVPASSDLVYFTEQGAGPPLLLVHGLLVTGEMFEPVIEHFAARRRVIVPDLRGHGRSRGLGPPYTITRLASDLSCLLDHLGIESTAVLGYSMGGAIAQQLFLDRPKRCNRLVLACSYAFKMATFRERLDAALVPILLNIIGMRRFAKFVLSQGTKQLGKERAEWVAGLIANQDRKLMVSAWRAAIAFDSRPRLADIKCPTLVVAASNDHTVPLHHAKMLHDGITSSQLVIIDGANHALIWTRPDELLQVVDEFLGA
ncbi:MAG TPA: alpha/beta hydrolase [Chthoniobacterales bacterium]|nr:alpha/beta hydrolase [Chthoniobacterales bacterium]